MPRATVDLHLRFDADISGDLLAALLIREQAQAHPAVQRAIEEEDFQRGLPDPADPARVASPAAAEPAPEPAKPPPAAKKRTTAGKPPAGNGSAERATLTEPEMRALLADMASAHPQKVAAVVSLLRTVGGSARLLDCPQEKWMAIEDAARAVLAELRSAVS
jgi:hypothetical protein